ncbi:MAG: hypothetical protein AAGF74_15930 [Pseudomonadota bacterium]
MERAHPAKLGLCLLGILIVFGGAGILRGGVYAAKHEGDIIHLLDILLRIDQGATPHLDFLTPIGALAFWPVTWTMDSGVSVGAAFAVAQALVCAAVLSGAWWVGITRLSLPLAVVFGLMLAALSTAFVHGGSAPTLSLSMHYNRWAWAYAFVAIALVLLPARDGTSRTIDGIFLGLCAMALLLTKVSYVAGLAPGILVVLLAQKNWRCLGGATLTFAVTFAAVTGLLGVNFWLRYLSDVLAVVASETRIMPGLPLRQILGNPAFLAANLSLLATVIVFRRAGALVQGLGLLLLFPGFVFITYQNFGNDPQWLYLIPLLILAVVPGLGPEARDRYKSVLFGLSIFIAALAAPSFFNLAYSPFRHLSADPEGYVSVIRQEGRYGDVLAPANRLYRASFVMDQMGPGGAHAPFAADLEDELEPPKGLNEEVFAACDLSGGLASYFAGIAQDLEGLGYAGENVFFMDILTSLWLYGDFPVPELGAPWQYGHLSGLGDARYALFPLCPIHPPTRQALVNAFSKTEGVTATVAERRPLYVLYELQR